MSDTGVVAEARRRGRMLDGWAHPERYAPKVLPESLPAPIPPWWTEHVEDEVVE